MGAKVVRSATALLTALLLTSPIFFDIYRTAAFDTMPRDPYPEYVLVLAGHPAASPQAPVAYRIGSVALALPFYYLLPVYRFSNLKHVDPALLRAVEALAAVSYLSILATAFVVYLTARRRFRSSRLAAVVCGLVSILLAGFTATVGVDPLAILVVALLVYWIDSPAAFIPLVLFSAAVNEKIPMIFAIVFASRLVSALWRRQRFPALGRLVASWLAVAAYFVARLVLAVPGYENQTDPTTFLHSAASTLAVTFSAKGTITNVVPIAIMAFLVGAAVRAGERGTFEIADVAGVLGLLLIALAANLGVTLGRIVMYCYPLYLPAMSDLLESGVREGGKRVDLAA